RRTSGKRCFRGHYRYPVACKSSFMIPICQGVWAFGYKGKVVDFALLTANKLNVIIDTTLHRCWCNSDIPLDITLDESLWRRLILFQLHLPILGQKGVGHHKLLAWLLFTQHNIPILCHSVVN